MEITECSTVSLETQNSQKSSQDIKNLSKPALDVETSTAKKGQTASVNENQSENILKSTKVYKRVKKLQCANESDKQLKRTYRLQKCKSVDVPKLSPKQSKQRKGKNIKPVNLDNKCNGNKSCNTGDDLGAVKDASEKLTISKQDKSNKLQAEKKSPSEGSKQKLVSQHSKKLLLSDYVTLSRDWTANRKTYTRNSIPVSVRAAGNYDCLTQKNGENNSESPTQSADSVTKDDDNTLHAGHLLDKVVNEHTGDAEINISSETKTSDAKIDVCAGNSAEIDIPTEARCNNAEIDIQPAIRTDSTEISCQQITYDKAGNNALSDTRAVLSANETNSLRESSALQRRIKSTILKQKNAKSKRKSVHFSDKIDMPLDCLNRNDIILENAVELTAKNQEESMDQLGDVSANDAENASIEIDKIQCPVIERTAYTKIVQNKNNVKADVVACDEKMKQEVVKVNLVRRKRGRPRKVDAINDCKNENSMLKAKVLSKNKIAKLQDRKLKSTIFTTVANLQHKERKNVLPSGSVCKRGRPRKIIGSKLSTAMKHHRRSCKRKANLHKENEMRIKRDKKQNSPTTIGTISPQQIIKRKRGRPRKCSLEDNGNFEVNNLAEKKIKLDSLSTSSSEKLSESLVRPVTEKTANKENQQIIAAGILNRNDIAAEQQELNQKIDTLSALDRPPKLSVSANCTDIGNSEVLDELPSLKVNEDENEIKAKENSKKAHNIEMYKENAPDKQVNENKEQNVQNLENNLPDNEVNSEGNEKKEQEIQQTQKMDNLEDSEIAQPEKSIVVNNTNKGKTFGILKADVEPSRTSCSDLNLVTSKSTEQELQNVELYNLEASEAVTSSYASVIESKAYQHKVYDKQQRLNYHNVEMSEVPSNVKKSENEHPKQKVYKNINLKESDLEALSELSNHDTNTFGSETKEQNKCRKDRKLANFKASEICDNVCSNDETEVQKKYKRKCKRTVSVARKLLKKTSSISKKMKRKRKTNTYTSGTSENFGTVDGEKSFVCGVCKQVYNKFREINRHIMLCHNGLARINDDTPFSSEEELSAFNLTLKTVRQLTCLQPDCGKKFISVLGYKYHRESCGAPKVNCEICGKAFKEIYLAKHIRVSHAAQPLLADHQNLEEEITLEELPKRGAAVKALKKMENFIKTQKFCLEEENDDDNEEIELDDEDDDSDDEAFTVSDSQESEFSADDYDNYFEKPEHFSLEMLNPWRENIKTPSDVAEEISQQMSGEWEKSLAETGKLECGKKNCAKDFVSMAEMKSHLEICGAKKWICKLCLTTYSSGLSLFSHMKINHYLQEIVNDTDGVSKKSSYSHISNTLNTSFDHSGTSRLLTPYLPAMEWNMKFQKKHYKNELFTQWKPHSTNWIQMKKKNSSEYLPPLKESAYIKSVKEKSIWTRFGLFECPEWADEQRQKTFFVGGSVWGSAWCPTGMNSKAVQFLALAANSPAPHLLTDCSNHKGLIQLWDMGILDTNRSLSTPNLTLAIAHENGSIRDMEWCPSGCWEEASDVQTEKKSSGLLPRLGLLAVACSNSSVRIYSIPHPHSIVKTNDSLPIFRCRPVVVLVCPESAPNISCHRTLCTKVSWQKTNGHSCLAAGFGNGMVCLWNLISSSPLLTISQFGGQLTLRPYLSFPAHGACIMGLLWVPVCGGQYLSTAGYDRCVKVWNLQDHNWPLLVTKRGLITDIAWLPYWCGVFASLDDCYNLHHTSTFYKECGYYSFASKAISAHSGCTWSISLSDWLNTEASGDMGGEVIITILCQLMKLVDGIKLMSHRRVPLFKISMETIKGSDENEKQSDNAQQNKHENNEESMHLARSNEKEENSSQPTNQKVPSVDLASFSTYEEAVKKVGLVLHDNNMEDFSAIPESELRRVRRPETMSSYAPDQYPLNSINKVSWNPNLGSHLWLFSAGQAGIARICCVYGLQSVKLKDTENKCKEKFKTAADGL